MRGFTIASTIVLVVVVVVVGTAAVLLARTVQKAQSINAKAQNIAKNGRGINTATDSIIQLTRTNKLAESILRSARPLNGQLGGIVGTAQGIDGLAGSINSTAGGINSNAGSINGSAGRINTSAGGINNAARAINSSAGAINGNAGAINGSAGAINRSAGSINTSAGKINTSAGSINTSAGRINSSAGSILRVARKIDTDVKLINTNLDVTLSLVKAVKGDTGNILGQAGGANDTAACIDRKLFGQSGEDGDCKGQATPASRQRGAASAPPKLEDLRKLLPANPPPKTRSAPPGGRDPERKQPTQAPLPEGRPKVPAGPSDDVLGVPLPSLGQGQGQGKGRPGGGSPGGLVDLLFSGPGQ